MAIAPLATAAPSGFQADYNAYTDQMAVISNTVDNDNWSKANGAYQQLGVICGNIANDGAQYQNAANDCQNAVSLIVQGSSCNGNCHTEYNRTHNGPIVDRGLRELDTASSEL